MDWTSLFSALALVLVIEGLLPFAAPQSFKKTMAAMLSMDNGALRLMGLASMLLGLLVLYFVRG